MRSCCAVLAAGVSLTAPAQEKINLSIGTGGPGVYYRSAAAGQSALVRSRMRAAPKSPGLGGQPQAIASSKPHRLSMADAGQTPIAARTSSRAVPLRPAVLYPNHARRNRGKHRYQRMADLKGKRVSTGSPGSATEVMAFRVIEASGLDKDRDLKRERLGVAESVNAIKDGKIDAFFWVGGLPTAAVTDLANTPNVKIKMIDHSEAVAAMNKKYGPLYVTDTIPKDIYKGMAADNRIATVWNILVSHEKLSDQAAYNIVKTIFEKRAD
jgi:TRAP transporter TAXI family solute receptor